MRADEFDPERVDEFGPTDADEGVVQEAEELKHVPAPILPFEAEVESHNVSHLPFRSWCSACVCGRGLSLGHCEVDKKTKEGKQNRLSLWITGSLGNQKTDRAHDTLPVLIVRDRKSKGIWSHPMPSKGVTHPYLARALMADLDFMGTGESSSSQIRSPALLPSVTLSRMVGMARWCLKHFPRARARAMERSKRAPSKNSWSNNLESRWSLEVRCWLGWSSIVPIFSRTTITQPTCV